MLSDNKINITFKNFTSFVEFGSGSTDKISILLNKKVKYYIPLDISFDFINESSNALRKKFPRLKIIPTYCDYNKFINLPNKITNLVYTSFLLIYEHGVANTMWHLQLLPNIT